MLLDSGVHCARANCRWRQFPWSHLRFSFIPPPLYFSTLGRTELVAVPNSWEWRRKRKKKQKSKYLPISAFNSKQIIRKLCLVNPLCARLPSHKSHEWIFSMFLSIHRIFPWANSNWIYFRFWRRRQSNCISVLLLPSFCRWPQSWTSPRNRLIFIQFFVYIFRIIKTAAVAFDAIYHRKSHERNAIFE